MTNRDDLYASVAALEQEHAKLSAELARHDAGTPTPEPEATPATPTTEGAP